MRVVLLQSAIQNPKSRIQNRVSALRRSSLGHGHGQAIGAGMHDSAPWKAEETIIGLSQLPVLSGFSRFGGCHEWHSVKPNTLGLKVLRTKTPARRLIINNMISISLDPKPVFLRSILNFIYVHLVICVEEE